MYDIYTSNESSCNFAISYEKKMYIFDRTNGLILKGILKARARTLAAARQMALRARSLAGKRAASVQRCYFPTLENKRTIESHSFVLAENNRGCNKFRVNAHLTKLAK